MEHTRTDLGTTGMGTSDLMKINAGTETTTTVPTPIIIPGEATRATMVDATTTIRTGTPATGGQVTGTVTPTVTVITGGATTSRSIVDITRIREIGSTRTSTPGCEFTYRQRPE